MGYEWKERELLDEAKKNMKLLEKKLWTWWKNMLKIMILVREAKVRAQEIIASAQRDAKAIRLGARDYADEILSQLEKEIETKGEGNGRSMKDDLDKFIQ